MFFYSEDCRIVKQTFHFHLMLIPSVILLLPSSAAEGPRPKYNFGALYNPSIVPDCFFVKQDADLKLCTALVELSAPSNSYYCHYDLALWVSQMCLVIRVLATGFNPLPLLFKALLHGQKDHIFFSGHLIYTLQQERLGRHGTFKSRALWSVKEGKGLILAGIWV
jgi:hypothetical protein